MPEMDWLEVCRALRKTSQVPILFLTARADEIDRVVGLELGADDYVSKPFSPRELVARVRAILKRSTGEVADQAVLRRGIISVDPARHLCEVDRTMDSHLRNLRSKLGKAGCADAIETVHGVGIRMGACRGA